MGLGPGLRGPGLKGLRVGVLGHGVGLTGSGLWMGLIGPDVGVIGLGLGLTGPRVDGVCGVGATGTPGHKWMIGHSCTKAAHILQIVFEVNFPT